MKILYVRHGETDWNKECKVQGRTDNPLNDKGIEQAKETAEKLKNEKIDIIISSPLTRAFQTAEIINWNHKKNIETNDKFIEVYFGDWEGQTSKGNEFEFVRYYMENAESLNAETKEEFTSRIHKALDEIIDKHKDCDAVLIVAHGLIWRAVHEYFNKMSKEELDKITFAKNCKIYEYEVE